jgi:hypothetical protein
MDLNFFEEFEMPGESEAISDGWIADLNAYLSRTKADSKLLENVLRAQESDAFDRAFLALVGQGRGNIKPRDLKTLREDSDAVRGLIKTRIYDYLLEEYKDSSADMNRIHMMRKVDRYVVQEKIPAPKQPLPDSLAKSDTPSTVIQPTVDEPAVIQPTVIQPIVAQARVVGETSPKSNSNSSELGATDRSVADPSAPLKPTVAASSAPPRSLLSTMSEVRHNVEQLHRDIIKIEDAMPAMSYENRIALQEQIGKIRELILEIEQCSDEESARAALNKAPTIKINENGISVAGTVYEDYIFEPPGGKKIPEKWLTAYQIEKQIYAVKLRNIEKKRDELEKLQAQIDEKEKLLENEKNVPPGAVDPSKEEALIKLEEELEAERRKLDIERASAASALVTLTKEAGGYGDPEKSRRLRMFRGGGLGFETRVMTRFAAREAGLMDDKLGGASVSQLGGSAYAISVGLAPEEVVVSTKSYPSGHRTVIVHEPGLVRDMSPKATKDPDELKECALQMALSMAFDYRPGKAVVIQGGEPELRQLIHAYLLALKHASQEGTVDMTMQWFFGQTVTEGVNALRGQKLASIDLRDMKILSDVGPQQYASSQSLLGKLGAHFHSAKYNENVSEKAFVEGLLGNLKGTTFESRKEEYLKIRGEHAKQTSEDDKKLTLVNDEPSSKRPKK